jgi:hypothetical protein
MTKKIVVQNDKTKKCGFVIDIIPVGDYIKVIFLEDGKIKFSSIYDFEAEWTVINFEK